MCADQHHIFGLPTGLPCVGTGSNHARQYQASDGPDGHDASEAAAEADHG